MNKSEIRKLKKEARDACKRRGHDMKNFVGLFMRDRTIYRSKCKRCAMYVDVNTNPLPNQIDIGGTAVAMTCIKRPECTND